MKIEEFPTDTGISLDDWERIFNLATLNSGDVFAVLMSHSSIPEGHGTQDVVAILALENNQIGVLAAAANTTGDKWWAGAHSEVFNTLPEAYRFGLTEAERALFAIKLPYED